MITRKGATMSPRMERLWTFMRGRRIGLDDWSTDECVEREQKALKAGEEELISILAKSPDDRDLQHLLIDYRTIMNRRPHERATQAQIDASEKRALAARAEDEIGEQISRGRR